MAPETHSVSASQDSVAVHNRFKPLAYRGENHPDLSDHGQLFEVDEWLHVYWQRSYSFPGDSSKATKTGYEHAYEDDLTDKKNPQFRYTVVGRNGKDKSSCMIQQSQTPHLYLWISSRTKVNAKRRSYSAHVYQRRSLGSEKECEP